MSTPEPTKPDSSPAAYDWKPYFDARRGQPPRDTLVRALDAFEREDALLPKAPWRFAVDLGCGEGTDLREVLRRNNHTRWKAIAMDVSDRPVVPGIEPHRWYFHRVSLEVVPSLFSEYMIYTDSERKVNHVDLINASFSLPFCEPASFPALWQWIVDKLKPSGRFAGQFFGVDDEWRRTHAVPAKTFHTRAEVEAMLGPFEVEHLEEVNRPGKTSVGEPKHWHVFHVVAKKRG